MGIPELAYFITRISVSPSVHRTNHAACLRELCVLIWDGLWTMEYGIWNVHGQLQQFSMTLWSKLWILA